MNIDSQGFPEAAPKDHDERYGDSVRPGDEGDLRLGKAEAGSLLPFSGTELKRGILPNTGSQSNREQNGEASLGRNGRSIEEPSRSQEAENRPNQTPPCGHRPAGGVYAETADPYGTGSGGYMAA